LTKLIRYVQSLPFLNIPVPRIVVNGTSQTGPSGFGANLPSAPNGYFSFFQLK
jgi:hypothetical protein